MSQISLTFPDGSVRQYDSGITPAEVATSIAPSLAKAAISAQLNDTHWDLQWPITADAKLSINTLKDDKTALELIRHDCAHIMARAVQEIWPDVKVTIGPVRDYGWFYDFDHAEPFMPEDLSQIEARMKQIINARDPVKTEIWNRARAIAYYKERGEPYKIELINRIPENEPLRMYWHGPWQDLCRGPHLAHTGQVPADGFKLMNVAGAYWLGDSSRPMLQRIYGVAFKNHHDLKAHLTMLEEAAKRDHRKLGREMGLFHMQEEAPGQIFWHPNGWSIYTTLQDYMRR
ncbi:MAG: TGS domain-containing protein, partial [Rhodobacteraceae bacterium]|nr:TGS domain-containing protein [Paracoccaceae bacterium]